MGVRSLTTFIENNQTLLQDNYKLSNTHLVVDGSNLMNLITQDRFNRQLAGDRSDLFGGDMVKFGSYLNELFDNFEKCKIVPVLVMDGAQTFEVSKSKVSEKLARSRERFSDVMEVNRTGLCKNPVLPPTAEVVFKSVAIDRGVKLHQSFFEADLEVARLARELKCPVLSGDSDFFLVDLPQGLIPILSLKWQEVMRSVPTGSSDGGLEYYMSCKLYSQLHFKKCLADFNIECLPLLGPLVGNDFVTAEYYKDLCKRLPSAGLYRFSALSFQHKKIAKVLTFFSGKTPEQVIEKLSTYLTPDRRAEFKQTLGASMRAYHPPLEDTYEAELKKIYQQGFRVAHPRSDTSECDRAISLLAGWLIRCSKSVMSHKILDLLNRNIIFTKPFMDDVSLPSAFGCHNRVYAVVLRLLRPTPNSRDPIEIYDRIGSTYAKNFLQQIGDLEKFGQIEYLAYDLPTLALGKRTDLVLATFHKDHEEFANGQVDCARWFDPKNFDEFATVFMLMDYIDIENSNAKLWKEFRQATLLCIIYHLCIKQADEKFSARQDEFNDSEFVSGLKELIEKNSLDKMPRLGTSSLYGERSYQCGIMHQLCQLQVTLADFNSLNAFLGDPLKRLRAEKWLNCSLIYNLTEGLKNDLIKIQGMPDIVAHGVDSWALASESPTTSPQLKKDAAKAAAY